MIDARLVDALTQIKNLQIQLAMQASDKGDEGLARWMYDMAAEVEERMANDCMAVTGGAWIVHAMSAISCWMRAGSTARANAFLDRLPKERRLAFVKEGVAAYEGYMRCSKDGADSEHPGLQEAPE